MNCESKNLQLQLIRQGLDLKWIKSLHWHSSNTIQCCIHSTQSIPRLSSWNYRDRAYTFMSSWHMVIYVRLRCTYRFLQPHEHETACHITIFASFYLVIFGTCWHTSLRYNLCRNETMKENGLDLSLSSVATNGIYILIEYFLQILWLSGKGKVDFNCSIFVVKLVFVSACVFEIILKTLVPKIHTRKWNI